MRKITFAIWLSFGFLLLSGTWTFVLRSYFADAPKNSALWFVIAGLAVVLLVGLIHLLLKGKMSEEGKKIYTVFGFALNALALGTVMTGWYINRGFHNPWWMMAAVAALSVLYLFVMYAVMQIPFVKRAHNVFVIALLSLSLVGYVLLVIFTKTTYVSTYGYYMIVMIAFFFAVSIPSENENQLLSHLFVATYSVIAVAVLVLLIIAADGDLDLGLDLCDIIPGGENKKKDAEK